MGRFPMNFRLSDHVIVPILGISLGLLGAYIINLYTEPVPIAVYQRYADRTQVTSGDQVTITWREERTSECASIISRQLITSDGKIVQFEATESEIRPVGEGRGVFTFTVPPLFTNGPLTYRAKTEFVCNWVQQMLGGHQFTMPDIVFDYIMPPKAG